jgi:hypothetical protein
MVDCLLLLGLARRMLRAGSDSGRQTMRRALFVTLALAVMGSACGPVDWPMFRFESRRSGSSPDTSLSPAAVASSMVLGWTATTGSGVDSSPAVANGVVYVGSNDQKLYAFDASGSAGCAGTPEACAPLWSALTGGGVVSSPAVANGLVYVGSWDGNLYAFDAGGKTNCTGTPEDVPTPVDRVHRRSRGCVTHSRQRCRLHRIVRPQAVRVRRRRESELQRYADHLSTVVDRRHRRRRGLVARSSQRCRLRGLE